MQDTSLRCSSPQTESRLFDVWNFPRVFAYLSTAAAQAIRVIESADLDAVVAIRARWNNSACAVFIPRSLAAGRVKFANQRL
jgi:hypothetical protein